MRKVLLATGISLIAIQVSASRADEALDKLAKDPKQWVMQQGDDANTRYSKLNQINASNVGSCRSPGHSRPACFAATKAARWWLAIRCMFIRRFRIRSMRWI